MEQLIIIGAYVFSIAAGLYILKRKNPLEVQVVFLFHQLLTWCLGIAVVEAGWIAYPVRELHEATRTSFLFEFLAFPVVACYFTLYFPVRGSLRKRILYHLAYPCAITVPEVLLEKFTRTIDYLHWAWYWTFISVWITLLLTRRFYKLYFGKGAPSVT